jgi:rhodanese-related sulfurtransferase
MRLPAPIAGDPTRVIVDVTWGRIEPMRLHAEVETIGEIELVEHLQAGLPLIDTRSAESFATATIAGARLVPFEEIGGRHREIDPTVQAILFCNGPQCPATPSAVRTLLDIGHPPRMLRYYRGGMHDWITLGLPVVQGLGGQVS